MDELPRLQKNLALIRSCAGWTAAVLAEKLGVKRQTISTIEQGEEKYKMTKMQYLAIRKILDDEIAASKEDTQMLYYVIDALVDHPGDYTDAERTEILSKAKLLAPSIVKQPSERKSASNAWKAILAASGVVVSAALIAILGHNKD
ncbi:MAG: helix-turn-helix domain-containing protein [Clostridia bacterium]|nr:helix-turn-helix domain-containing protein [Clostridia bacterium]